MGTITAIFSILKFLPQVLDYVKHLEGLIDQGVTAVQISNAMKNIDKAFVITDIAKRAKSLNDEFRK